MGSNCNCWRKTLEGTQRSEQVIRAAERAKQTVLDNLKTISKPEIVKNLKASFEANEREIARLREELAHAALFDYIEVFYNRQQLHSGIGYVAPVSHAA